MDRRTSKQPIVYVLEGEHRLFKKMDIEQPMRNTLTIKEELDLMWDQVGREVMLWFAENGALGEPVPDGDGFIYNVSKKQEYNWTKLSPDKYFINENKEADREEE